MRKPDEYSAINKAALRAYETLYGNESSSEKGTTRAPRLEEELVTESEDDSE